MATLDPILDTRFREERSLTDRSVAKVEARVDDLHNKHTGLEHELFGYRKGDPGVVGELQQGIKDIKKLLTALLLTLITTLMGAVITVIVAFHK